MLVDVPSAEVAAFCAATLGPLEAHDAAHGTDLVGTLATFLATRNAALAARQLYVHYNTLKNRLARIEEVLGPCLDDPERCLALALALRLRRIPGVASTSAARAGEADRPRGLRLVGTRRSPVAPARPGSRPRSVTRSHASATAVRSCLTKPTRIVDPSDHHAGSMPIA